MLAQSRKAVAVPQGCRAGLGPGPWPRGSSRLGSGLDARQRLRRHATLVPSGNACAVMGRLRSQATLAPSSDAYPVRQRVRRPATLAL